MLFNFSKRYIALVKWKELALELSECSNTAIEAWAGLPANASLQARTVALSKADDTGITRFYKNIIFINRKTYLRFMDTI